LIGFSEQTTSIGSPPAKQKAAVHLDYIANGKRCCLRTGDRHVARSSHRKGHPETWFYSKPRTLGDAANPEHFFNDGRVMT
jgi:hypothetical protein